ncbi:MAG TPA: hypothetical protein VF461_12700 [Gemmatimonadaceae bacterium]
MKLSAYIVAVDSGFSPNPFGRRCTLACCKPSIRRNAEPGDIIVGSGSARTGLAGRLIYAMRVQDVLPFEVYWKRYPSKRPSQRTAVSRRGDNIWHFRAGVWRGIPGALHDQTHRARDLSGENALVAAEFYYFGRDAIVVPEAFASMLAVTQGHKNTYDNVLISRFWTWLSRVAPRNGRIGQPTEFTDGGCRAQRADKDDDNEIC